MSISLRFVDFSNEGETFEKIQKFLKKDFSIHRVGKDDLFDKDELAQGNAVIINIGDEDSYAVCETITSIRNSRFGMLPIWVFGDRELTYERLLFLQLGVNGVFDKSFSLSELFLSIDNSIKYPHELQEQTKGIDSGEENCDIRLLHSNFSVSLEGNSEIELTKMEFKLLEFLSAKPKCTFAYKEIYEHLWHQEYHSSKRYRISNTIFRIREKLGDLDGSRYIKTVHSKGYLLNVEEVQR
ncbi:response regulator transcription factor [Enterococcus sp. BWM-S5]|uniref:Response regulator transcription factor n=1 Tax=Enterococcus larvae TaxID=2794352 RepID=A0ABS4CKN8_9ENTE|nr:winged helix-turn-helix domain-containing protein [Enterococcus larvae]MBP1046507.1 response regulator transcription factor [Enterococcus larvae]